MEDEAGGDDPAMETINGHKDYLTVLNSDGIWIVVKNIVLLRIMIIVGLDRNVLNILYAYGNYSQALPFCASAKCIAVNNKSSDETGRACCNS